MSFHGSLSVRATVCTAAHPKSQLKILNLTVYSNGVVHLHLENGIMCYYKYSKVKGWCVVERDGKRVPTSHWSQRYALIEPAH